MNLMNDMSGYRATRRRFLLGAGILAALPLIQACGAAPATPTSAPAAPAQPAAPTATTAPSQPAAAQPTATTSTTAPTATVASATTQPTVTPAAVAAATGGGKATITLWTHDDGLVSFMGNRFKEWIPSKPGWDIKTDFLVVPDPPTKELTALAANQGVPDFFGVQSDNFSKFQKGDICVNAFVPIDTLIKEAGGPDAFVKLSIYSWKGKMYAADWAAAPLLFFYREDLFQAAGVKLPIETFDDLANEGQKLKTKGQFIEQLNASGPWLANFDQYLPARNVQGGFDKDGEGFLDTQQAIDTLQMMSDLAHKQKVLDVYDTSTAEVVGYQRNQVAGTIHADWWAHYIMEAEVK